MIISMVKIAHSRLSEQIILGEYKLSAWRNDSGLVEHHGDLRCPHVTHSADNGHVTLVPPQ